MSIRKAIKCAFNFHTDNQERVIVSKSKTHETANHRWVCRACGRKTEWEGSTWFESFNFKIK